MRASNTAGIAQTPYVSVVITSYNREKYIGQAIDSILAQQCTFPFEIIIGDDGLHYDPREDDCYRYAVLLRLACDKADYPSAHAFARHVDPRNKKKYFAMTRLTFHLFRLARNLKRKLTN